VIYFVLNLIFLLLVPSWDLVPLYKW
jgi:hypothetical protein